MTTRFTRPTAGFALAALVAAATGCGKTEPTPAKDNPKDGVAPKAITISPPGPDGTPVGPGGTGTAPTTPTAPALVASLGKMDDPGYKAGQAFLAEFTAGKATHAALTPGFFAVVGRPPQLDKGEKSADQWLARVGPKAAQIVPPGPPLQVGNRLVLTGGFVTADQKDGRYRVRMENVGGTWKVDWVQLSTAKPAAPPAADLKPEDALLEFSLDALLDAVADPGSTPPADRVPLAVAAFAPAYRTQVAEPTGPDKEKGYDYSPTKALSLLTGLAPGADGYARIRDGTKPEFVVTFTKAGSPVGNKYRATLAKDAATGLWQVTAFQNEG